MPVHGAIACARRLLLRAALAAAQEGLAAAAVGHATLPSPAGAAREGLVSTAWSVAEVSLAGAGAGSLALAAPRPGAAEPRASPDGASQSAVGVPGGSGGAGG